MDCAEDACQTGALHTCLKMLTTHGGEEGILTGQEDEMSQHYMTIEEYAEDHTAFEDPQEPVNHFCINFVEDTLQIDSIGVYRMSHETSIDNRETEETVLEAERIDTKGDMRELKSNDTQAAEQKGNEGHPATEMDSLRTNANNEPTIKPEYGNTEDSLIHKVKTDREMVQYNEPLCPAKLGQEMESDKLATGKSERETEISETGFTVSRPRSRFTFIESQFRDRD